jgi:hypothetical protein
MWWLTYIPTTWQVKRKKGRRIRPSKKKGRMYWQDKDSAPRIP